MENNDIRLAADFGGTKLMLGLVDSSGRILEKKLYPTGTRKLAAGAQIILDSMEDFLSSVASPYRPSAAGLGLVGRVDPEKGLWLCLYEEGDNPLPLAEKIREKVSNQIVKLSPLSAPAETVDLNIRTSLGVAEAPRCAENERDLVFEADRALSKAKEKGRNRVELAE